MAHDAQRAFFRRVRAQFPEHFRGVRVLDCGSLNVNGSLREFFDECAYIGIDIRAGRDVDHVTLVHEYRPPHPFDTVVSSEMLEHDEHWEESLQAMLRALRPGGLLALSCAGPDRPEHGTTHAPDTIGGPQGDGLWGTSPDYYRTISFWDLNIAFRSLRRQFASWGYESHGSPVHDTYFWVIKRAAD